MSIWYFTQTFCTFVFSSHFFGVWDVRRRRRRKTATVVLLYLSARVYLLDGWCAFHVASHLLFFVWTMRSRTCGILCVEKWRENSHTEVYLYRSEGGDGGRARYFFYGRINWTGRNFVQLPPDKESHRLRYSMSTPLRCAHRKKQNNKLGVMQKSHVFQLVVISR